MNGLKFRRCQWVYSSDGRYWRNSAEACEILGLSSSAITEALRRKCRAAGLRWSRQPFALSPLHRRWEARRYREWKERRAVSSAIGELVAIRQA